MRLAAFAVVAVALASAGGGLCSLTCTPGEAWEPVATCCSMDYLEDGICPARADTGILDTGSGAWLSQRPYRDPYAREDLEDMFASGEGGGVTTYFWRHNRGFTDKDVSEMSPSISSVNSCVIVYQLVGRCSDQYAVYSTNFCTAVCSKGDAACFESGCDF